MKGYKGMNQDMTCRGMKYEVGKTYHVDGEIKICKNGLHFCKNLRDVFSFYSRYKSRFFKVEAPTEKATSDGEKTVTSELTIVRELTQVEVNRIVYGYGYGDGYGNGYGDGYGNGYGDGYGYGDGDGYGYGYGYGYGNGYGDNIQRVLCFK